jgi:hypothetical protein
MRGQRAGRHVHRRRGQLTGNLEHVGNHQQQALRSRKRGPERAGLQRAMQRARRAAFALQLFHNGQRAPDILLALRAPLIGPLGHRRRGGNGVDRNNFGETIGYRGSRLVPIQNHHSVHSFALPHSAARSGKNDDSYSIDYLNAPLQMLMQQAGGVPASRLVIHGAKDAKYSLHISAPGGDVQDLASALQLAIVTATGMKLSHVTTEEEAWILQPTPKATSLLPPASSDQGSMCFYNPQADKLVMMQSNLDSLAETLEPVLGTLIVNETGMKGNFDANFSLPKGDVDAARVALETNLGLTLVKARRNIDRVVLDPLPPPSVATSK